jgi:hypothetical protein
LIPYLKFRGCGDEGKRLESLKIERKSQRKSYRKDNEKVVIFLYIFRAY